MSLPINGGTKSDENSGQVPEGVDFLVHILFSSRCFLCVSCLLLEVPREDVRRKLCFFCEKNEKIVEKIEKIRCPRVAWQWVTPRARLEKAQATSEPMPACGVKFTFW